MLGNSENEAMSLMETMAQNMYGGSVELEVAPVECIDKAGVEAARHRAGNFIAYLLYSRRLLCSNLL